MNDFISNQTIAENIQKAKERDIREAKANILKLKLLLVYLEDDEMACEVSMADVNVGLCLTKNMIPVINQEILEIEKFLRGEANQWE